MLTLSIPVVVLGVDSNHDGATEAGFKYRHAKVYPYLTQRGFSVTLRQGPLARRVYVAPEARKAEVDYITGIGHGTHDAYTGDFLDPIFSVGNYSPEEVSGKIIHFAACDTARTLGRDVVSKGCRAFFGYDVPFAFQRDAADVFFGCDSEIDFAFADGLSAKEVFARVKAVFEKRIAEFAAAGAVYKMGTLKTNFAHLRCPASGGGEWGSPDARLQ